MTSHAWIAIATLAIAIALFLKRRFPHEIVALGIPVALFATGTLSLEESLSGFGSRAVVGIAAIFVVGAGLQEAGVASWLARAIERLGGSSLRLLALVLMTVATLVSGMISTAAVVAVFTPAVMALSRRTGHPPSKLLLPLAIAAMLGCNLLQISSLPGMLVADHARERLGQPMSMFAVTPGGALMALAGIAVVVLIGLRLLPDRDPDDRLRAAVAPEEAARRHDLGGRLHRLRLMPPSPLAGRRIAQIGLRERYGLDAVAVARTRRFVRHFHDPRPDLVLEAGDELYVEGDDEAAFRFSEEAIAQLALAGTPEIEAILGRGLALAEITPSPRSTVLGKTVKDLAFRARQGLNVLTIWRRGDVLRENVAAIPLDLGDAVLVSGRPESVAALARDPDWVVLTEHARPENASRAPLALALLAVAIVPAMLGVAPLAVSALAAAILMVATGCLPIADARSAVDLRVLLMTIGMLPLGLALEKHGVATTAATGLLGVVAPLGGAAVLAAIVVLAAGVALVTTNATAAVVLAPVATSLSHSAGLDPVTALLAVAFGANATFLMPFTAANLLVMGPGGYETKDYLKVGGLVTVVVIPVAVMLLLNR